MQALKGTNKDEAVDRWAAISIFSLPALSITIPSGYSYGALSLFLCAVYLSADRTSIKSAWKNLDKGPKAIIAIMLIYSLYWILDASLRGEGIREFDRPSRFIFAAFCLLMVSKSYVRTEWLWAGIIIGSAGAGLIATWETFGLGLRRASGPTQVIQFGNISMILGLMCLSGILSFWKSTARWLWTTALTTAGVLGVLASFLSGTRGAWLIPIAIAVLVGTTPQRWARKVSYLTVLAILMGFIFSIVYHITDTGVKDRVQQVNKEIAAYIEDRNDVGSVTRRLEMWRGGMILFAKKPILGWGENQYFDQLNQLGASSVIEKSASEYTHAHNDWVNVLAKKGIVGALILSGLLAIPYLYFYSIFNDGRKKSKVSTADFNSHQKVSIGIAGMILVIGFFVAGMSQVSFNHNSGVMVYAFYVAVLSAITQQSDAST